MVLGDEVVDESHSGFKALFSQKYLTRTLFNCIFFVCIVIPYFAIYTFLPMILNVMNLTEGFGTEMLLNAMLALGSVSASAALTGSLGAAFSSVPLRSSP